MVEIGYMMMIFLTMIDIKAQLQGNFRVKKRDEDIRLIPKSSNIGSSKYNQF